MKISKKQIIGLFMLVLMSFSFANAIHQSQAVTLYRLRLDIDFMRANEAHDANAFLANEFEVRAKIGSGSWYSHEERVFKYTTWDEGYTLFSNKIIDDGTQLTFEFRELDGSDVEHLRTAYYTIYDTQDSTPSYFEDGGDCKFGMRVIVTPY